MELFKHGNDFWLILRSTFNHLFYMFVSAPHLMGLGFERLIAHLVICREIRSLDSDIHLYRLETMLPQVVPKKYENLSLDQIHYQGAYIRCVSMMMLESLIVNVLNNKETPAAHQVLNCLENIIVELLVINAKLEKGSQFEMPYSCLLYTSPSPRDKRQSRMPSSA